MATNNIKKAATGEDLTKFRVNRVKDLENLYSDELSTKRRQDQTAAYQAKIYKNAGEVRKALSDALTNVYPVTEASKKLYAVNPIYANIINTLANMFSWRYKVIPHKRWINSKTKIKKEVKEDEYRLIYHQMLELADGLSIETKFPAVLSYLFINGAVYYTTVLDEDSMTIDTLILPIKYCRKIGETQFGTAIIEFDMSYFTNLGLQGDKLEEYLESYPDEIVKGYEAYSKDSTLRWVALDPHFSSGIMMNEAGIPTYFYLYGAILDYEQYQDNELERNENRLKYLVSHKIPIYQDKLVFEVNEVKALHNSMKKVVDTGTKARLITTYGDIDVKQLSQNDTTENQVLAKAYKAIYENIGLNSELFTGNSVTALKMAIIRDRSLVWNFVQQLISFYNIAINNWVDFKSYEANIEILPISPYTYNDDIEAYRSNATLGVNKLDFIIASGVKQRHIEDQMALESFLNLDEITPMQTSYTQTAEDRSDDGENKDSTKKVKGGTGSSIEPLEKDSTKTETSTEE